ncbi:SGNH/GDSL hydrolase family protein [Actinokineospora iranica]|uniref:GDSL-like Lipase/Acylhydrolase family protein n=1 Tax=Actinokineospora iranica TaxID=1271860 RepID=A0A1G6YIU1_9PSEU|nr:SGNH/GDSL hydrolase family protein [Actinokineospora iranica]SDD90309.1 GDSL-like Lipase/Acylhydrolase family protein [Actinokineospora iranica]
MNRAKALWGVLAALLALVSSLAAPTASAEPETWEWVALGDSSTAGVFAGEPMGHMDGCERTDAAYPMVAADRLAADPPETPVRLVINAACSGATIADVVRNLQQPTGRGAPPDGWPEVPPQVEALNPGTDLVTIGIGADDLPFGKLLLDCVPAGAQKPDRDTPCHDLHRDSPPDGETVEAKFARIAREYRAMLRAVRARAPRAEIITIGYPSIVPEDPATCRRDDLTHFSASALGSITYGDLGWLRELNNALNFVIAAASVEHGAHFLDLARASQGHDVCQPRPEKWVEGVCGPPETRYPSELDAICAAAPQGSRRLTLIQPNSAGHANAGALLDAAIRDLLP